MNMMTTLGNYFNLYQNWFFFAASFCIILFLRPIIETGLRRFIAHIFKKLKNNFLSQFLGAKVEKPMSWIIVLMLTLVLQEAFISNPTFEKYISLFIKIFLAINIIQICYIAAEKLGESINQISQKNSNTAIANQLAPLASRTLKIFVIIVGSLILLQNLGVNVTALLAGLGLGGVALAFAAQDTVSNFFGTVTILLDNPFKIGDRVRILDVDGVVLEVGFRSTRLRTLNNSVVTLPNSVVAKEKIDNLAGRDRVLRFRHVLGFTYACSIDNIVLFCDSLRNFLKVQHEIDPERICVHITEYAESSINVLVSYHYFFENPDLEFKIQQDHLVEISLLVKKHALDFAFPTRTLFVNNSIGSLR